MLTNPVSLLLLSLFGARLTRAVESLRSRTRLRSTAFGTPGQDAVYDYVGVQIPTTCVVLSKLTFRRGVVGGGTAGITPILCWDGYPFCLAFLAFSLPTLLT